MMVAGGTFAVSENARNFKSTVLRAQFPGKKGFLDFAFASECRLKCGPEPSRAVVQIPLAVQNDSAPSVAFAGGAFAPMNNLKVGDRCRIVMQLNTGTKVISYDQMLGSVVAFDHDLNADGGAVEVLDDKWLLEGVSVIGSWIRIPVFSAAGVYQKAAGFSYRQRGPCVFNPDGRPNCLDDEYFGPAFAPYPDYGWTEGLLGVEPAPGQAVTIARSWRLCDVLEYLKSTLYMKNSTGFYVFGQTTDPFPEFQKLTDDYVVWPDGFGSAVVADDFNIAGDSDAAEEVMEKSREKGSQAKVLNLNLEGVNLLAALNEIISRCGAYGLYLNPQGEKSVMSIRPRKWIPGMKGEARDLRRPTSGTLPTYAVPKGAMRYDGAHCCSSVVVRGDSVFLEIRVEWNPALALTNAAQTLWPAWTRKNLGDSTGQTEEELFLAYLNTATSGTPPVDISKTYLAWSHATNKWPKVFCAFKIRPDWNWLAGTKYSTSERVSLSPPILRHLLTGASDDGDVAVYRSGSLRRFLSKPIVVETYSSRFASYQTAAVLSGVEVDEEGNIYFPALREAGLGATDTNDEGTWVGSIYVPLSILPRRIRMTLAFQLDHETLKSYGGIGDDPNLAVGIPRQYVVNAGQSYREYLRKDSWAVPESVMGAVKMPDRCAGGSELLYDEEYLETHALRRLAVCNRTERSGILSFDRHVMFTPGQLVNNVGTWPVQACVAEVLHTYDDRETRTNLILT